jgi:ABC-2 type transport system permease protein
VRRVWQIASKELLQNRRDRLAALFTLVLPVIFTVFLGLLIPATGDAGVTFPLALADSDETPAAQQLVERLKASSLLEIKPMTAAEVEKAVQDQKVAAGLVIPAGYGTAIGKGEPATLSFVRVGTSSGAQTARTAVERVVSEFNAAVLATKTVAEQVSNATGQTLNDTLLASAASMASAQLATSTITVATTNSGASQGSDAGGFDQSSSGALVNWVLFSLLGIAAGMVWERRQGLLRRLSVVGVRGREIVGGKILAMLIITFLQQLLLVLVGQLAFGVDYFSSPLALLITMVSLSMLAAAFGMLVSVLFRSEQAVIATTVISAQLLAALGGAWFPLEITGASFSKVAHYLPSAWVMDSLHGIILKGWGVVDVLHPMAIVWIWVVALFALAVWRYRPD